MSKFRDDGWDQYRIDRAEAKRERKAARPCYHIWEHKPSNGYALRCMRCGIGARRA